MKSRRRSENKKAQVRNKNAKAGESVSLNAVLYRRVILELCLEKLNDHTHAYEKYSQTGLQVR